MDYQTRLQCERRRLVLLFDNTARHVNHVRIRVSGEFRSSQQNPARSGPWGHRQGEPTIAVTKCGGDVVPEPLLSLLREATFFLRRRCLVLTRRLVLFFHLMSLPDWTRNGQKSSVPARHYQAPRLCCQLRLLDKWLV